MPPKLATASSADSQSNQTVASSTAAQQSCASASSSLTTTTTAISVSSAPVADGSQKDDAKVEVDATLSATALELKDIMKLRLRRVPFSGKLADWFAWKYTYTNSLVFGLSNYLIQQPGDKPMLSPEEASCLELLHGNLISCLPQHVLVLVMSLPVFVYHRKSDNGLVKLTCPHPNTVWRVLLGEFEKNTAVHQRKYFHELNNIRMLPGWTFNTYEAKVEFIVSQLRSMGVIVSEQQKLAYLLAGLPSSAGTAVTMVDCQEQITYDVAVAYLRRYFDRESGRGDHESSLQADAETDVLHASGHIHRRGVPTSVGVNAALGPASGVCFKCGRPGHIARNCHVRRQFSNLNRSVSVVSGRGRVRGGVSVDRGGARAVSARGARSFRSRSAALPGAGRSGPVGGSVSTCFYCNQPGHVQASCPMQRRHMDEKHGRASSVSSANGVVLSVGPTSNAHKNAQVLHVSCSICPLVMDRSVSSGCVVSECIIDSGAEFHICNNSSWFVEMHVRMDEAKKQPEPLHANGFSSETKPVIITHVGSVSLCCKVGDGERRVTLTDVAYVPTARFNLISTSALCLKGCSYMSVSNDPNCHWRCMLEHMVVMEAVLSDRRLLLKLCDDGQGRGCVGTGTGIYVNPAVKDGSTLQRWHERLACLYSPTIIKMGEEKMVDGLRITDTAISACDVCPPAKLHRSSHHAGEVKERSVVPMERIHSDTSGRMSVTSLGGKTSFITFIDDASRYVVVDFMADKKETFNKFIHYKTFWSEHLGKRIRYLRIDNGTEYKSDEWMDELEKSGIKRELTVPHTPSQNGVAERYNRTLKERARAMLIRAHMPVEFWAEAILSAADIINVSACKALKGHVPHTLWFGTKPDVSGLRVFGCEAFARVHKPQTSFDSRSVRCVYLGKDHERKAYRLYDPTNNCIISACDVVFNEDVFPFKDAKLFKQVSGHDYDESDAVWDDEDDDEDGMHLTDDDDDDYEPARPNVANHQPQQPIVPPPSPPAVAAAPGVANGGAVSGSSTVRSDVAAAPDRVAEPQHHQQASDVKSAASAPQQHRDVVEVKARPTRVSARANKNVPPARYGFSGVVEVDASTPRTITEAWNGPNAANWKAATDKEMGALEKAGTWELVKLPQSQTAVDCVWVLRVKPDGTYKARLCAKGFQQVQGVQFGATFAPVGNYTSLRVVLAIAIARGYHLHQYDVVSAFLNGKLEHEVYMRQPEGYDDGSGRVCRLIKSIYGLKQSPYEWNCEVNATLCELGFVQSSECRDPDQKRLCSCHHPC